MKATEEQFARHLRANRNVGIDIHRTIIPEGWVMHPETRSKVTQGESGEPSDILFWILYLSLWKKHIRH